MGERCRYGHQSEVVGLHGRYYGDQPGQQPGKCGLKDSISFGLSGNIGGGAPRRKRPSCIDDSGIKLEFVHEGLLALPQIDGFTVGKRCTCRSKPPSLLSETKEICERDFNGLAVRNCEGTEQLRN